MITELSRIRAKLHEVIFEAETPAGKAFDVALLNTIILSIIAVLLESVTGVRARYGTFKHIDLLQEMQRAMAKQAEAERERRAKVINAEGEYQAAQRLAEAAAIIQKYPVALQLRFLQTLREVAAENNSTTLFPVPIDLFEPFLKKFIGGKEK